MKDVNMDAEVYVKILQKHLLPAVARIRRCFWTPLYGDDYDVVIQHDGAPGHRADGIEAYIPRTAVPGCAWRVCEAASEVAMY